MKVLLFCMMLVLLFFVSEDAKIVVKGGKCNAEEIMEAKDNEERLSCNIILAYHHLHDSLASMMQTGMQIDQEKAFSFLRRFVNEICYAGGTLREGAAGVNQFTAFLSGRHLHGFYVFCLSRLLI